MSNKVTYSEIVEALSRKTGISKQKSEKFIKGLIDVVKQDLEENGKATITNFGSFSVKEVSEREGQNPQTGEPITIPAHKRVTFNPYKALREKVNAEYSHLESELLEEKSEEPETEVSPEKTERKPYSYNREKDNNTGLMIAALLMLVVVAIASGWFLMTTDSEEMASDKAALENQQTPEAAPEVNDESTKEASENVRENQQEQAAAKTEGHSTGDLALSPSVYKVQQNEWYWVIAEKVYGKARFWPMMFQANEDIESDPDQLFPSTGLKVPELEGTATNPSKNDYRNLSEATWIVSRAYLKAGKKDKADEYARFAKKWELNSR